MVSSASLIQPSVLILVPLTIGILARYFDLLPSIFERIYRLVIIIILPALVFGAIAVKRPLGILSLGGASILALIGLSATTVAAAASAHALKWGREKTTEIFVNGAFMNYTFLGLAVVQSTIGTGGLAQASIYAVTVGIVHLTVGITLTKTSAGGDVEPLDILYEFLTFPAAFALIVAVLFVGFEAGVPFWSQARGLYDNYANLASFLMVLAAGYKMRIGPLRRYFPSMIEVGTLRFIVCPLSTFGAAVAFGIGGWNVTRIALLLSAMPPGTFNVILAERFGLDKESYGSIVFYLTLVSLFVAVPLLLHLTYPGFSLI